MRPERFRSGNLDDHRSTIGMIHNASMRPERFRSGNHLQGNGYLDDGPELQ